MLVTDARTAKSPLETNGKLVIGGRISTTLSCPFGGGGEAGAESPKKILSSLVSKHYCCQCVQHTQQPFLFVVVEAMVLAIELTW
jgi:hypothetical protein